MHLAEVPSLDPLNAYDGVRPLRRSRIVAGACALDRAQTTAVRRSFAPVRRVMWSSRQPRYIEARVDSGFELLLFPGVHRTVRAGSRGNQVEVQPVS